MSRAHWVAFLALIPVTLGAQTRAPQRVVVVQIAGSNLYLNAGNDSGVVTGDTLSVGRPGSELNGSFLVITATATRSVVSFAGPAFAVTRGDTLLLTRGFHPAPAPNAAVAGTTQ